MHVFEMVVWVVGLVMAAGIIKHFINQEAAQKKQQTDSEIDSLNHNWGTRVDKLEKRVQVLESIITSDGFDLKQQFKDLDKR